MSTLVVGDVHGCAAELAALLDLAQPSRLVLVGDVFTKGPDAKGVWSLVETWRAVGVLGNHDARMLAEPGRFAHLGLPAEAWAWLSALPLYREVGGWWVVHGGFDPYRGPEGTRRGTAISVRRWPDDKDTENPFWWQLWKRTERVVYGHDAARGLQDHRPHTLGLDSGCVYGGRLSGYLLEDDRIVSVAAQGTYREVEPWPPKSKKRK